MQPNRRQGGRVLKLTPGYHWDEVNALDADMSEDTADRVGAVFLVIGVSHLRAEVEVLCACVRACVRVCV